MRVAAAESSGEVGLPDSIEVQSGRDQINFKYGKYVLCPRNYAGITRNYVQRLIDLLDEEQDIPILAPIIQKEIIYLLLVGEQGARLRQIASAGSQSQQIARAIEWLKNNFNQQLRIDDLASRARMSTSSFHNHFRSMTALSPLQYQKHLRLHEARRLMLAESMDAATAAFQVGYESPSQFSREYSRLFGTAPLRDISRLRQVPTAS